MRGVLKSYISLALWANMNFDALLCSYLLLWLGWSQLLNHHYLPSMTMYYLISRHFDEWWFYFWPQMQNIIHLCCFRHKGQLPFMHHWCSSNKMGLFLFSIFWLNFDAVMCKCACFIHVSSSNCCFSDDFEGPIHKS